MHVKADPYVLESETILPDHYTVYGNHWYWVDGRMERSDVFGNVHDLRCSIVEAGRTAKEVRRADMEVRVILYQHKKQVEEL